MRFSNSVHTLSCQAEILSSLFLHHRKQGHSFTLWRLPDSSEKHFLVCTGDILETGELLLEDSRPGFVFAPFDTSKNKFFLSADIVYSFKGDDTLEGRISQEDLLKMKDGFHED